MIVTRPFASQKTVGYGRVEPDKGSTDKKVPAFDIFQKKKAFFDLDGTVYLGNKLFEGAVELFERLRENNVEYYFLSNNSSKIKSDYFELLNSKKIYCKEENIILPTDSLIDRLREEGVTEIFLLGNSRVSAFFTENGINTQSRHPRYVIVTFDTEITYQKLKKASLFIQHGVPYMATNPDLVCPTEDGNIPDTGTLIQLLQTTTGIKPAMIFGKPLPAIIQSYIQHIDIDEVVIVGDRLYTDLELAKAINCDFVLTLSGETKQIDIPSLTYSRCHIVNSIADLFIEKTSTEIYLK